MGLLRSEGGPEEDLGFISRTSKMEGTESCCVKFLKSNLLAVVMVFGVMVGVAIGLGLNSLDPKLTGPQLVYLRFPGDIFIQLMKMLLIPIVVSSLLCATAEIDIRLSGKIGLRAVVYYLGTLVMASALGIAFALTIRPGERAGRSGGGVTQYTSSSDPGLSFMDLIRNMVSDNLIEACVSTKKTKLVLMNKTDFYNTTSLIGGGNNITENDPQGETLLVVEKIAGINMVGLVVASIVFGCVTSVAGDEAKPFLDFFKAFRCVSFRLMAVYIWYSPVGIAFLIAAKFADMDDPGQTFQSLGIFTVSVLAGLAVHGFLVLPLLYLIIVKKNPFKFFSGLLPALIFAFGSDSSNATLPLTIKCLEENNRVDPRVTKLIAPVGATVNMDGSCLYYSLMVIFVGQLNGVSFNAGELVTISIISLSIAVGAGGVPGSGVVNMILIVSSMGLPTHDISSLLAVDWMLMRVRTVTNVLGDAYGAGIIGHLSRHELRKFNIANTKDGSTKGVQENHEGGEMETLTSKL